MKNLIMAMCVVGAASPVAEAEVISAGFKSSGLAVDDLTTWGNNALGQLGLGSATASYNTSQYVSSGWISVSIGEDATCGVTDGLQLYCWGKNTHWQLGQPAAGVTTATTYLSPTLVASLANVTEVSVGAKGACAVASGDVYCWGSNTEGQVGRGDFAIQKAPKQVTGIGPAHGVTHGYEHACAIQTSDSRAYCWGSDKGGQLGDDATLLRKTVATPVAGALITSLITAISAGEAHTCALKGGFVFCWGDNFSGQLGVGTTTASPVPAAAVAGIINASRITAGYVHNCAIRPDVGFGDRVWCWGSNGSGQMGNGSTGGIQTTPVLSSGPANPTEIDAGFQHTCSYVQSTGLVWCWGTGTSGQLGAGSYSSSSSPVQVL